MLHFNADEMRPEVRDEIGDEGWAAGCDECGDYVSPGPRATEAEAIADGEQHDIDHHMKTRPGWGAPSRAI
jgi:hypothetical protein